MRGLLVGRQTIAMGVAVTATAGLIAATPPTPSHVPVTHRAVTLTAAPGAWPLPQSSQKLTERSLAATAAVVAAILIGGPVTVTAAVVAAVNALGLLDEPIDRLKKKLLEELPIDRIVDALPRDWKAEGEVIARLLETQRLANLTNLDSVLKTLQERLDRREKFTDGQIEKAKGNLTAVLGVVGATFGVQLPTSQVSSWFDQVDARADQDYAILEANLKKIQEHIQKQLNNPSPGAQPSARLAVSKTASSKRSAHPVAKTSATARSARPAGKPTAANGAGDATKSASTHARSPRAAK